MPNHWDDIDHAYGTVKPWNEILLPQCWQQIWCQEYINVVKYQSEVIKFAIMLHSNFFR